MGACMCVCMCVVQIHAYVCTHVCARNWIQGVENKRTAGQAISHYHKNKHERRRGRMQERLTVVRVKVVMGEEECSFSPLTNVL